MVRRQAIWGGMLVVGVSMLVVAWSLAHAVSHGAAERGRALYARHCAVCHGPEGQGRAQGNATSLNNPDFLAVASDTFLQTTIARGRRGTAMSGWSQEASGLLSREEIQDLVMFLRRWQQEVAFPPLPPGGRADPGRGQQIYEGTCANCHGWEGRGNLGMGPAVTNPDFLATADDAFLWATIAYGRRGTPMFPHSVASTGCDNSVRKRFTTLSPICEAANPRSERARKQGQGVS